MDALLAAFEAAVRDEAPRLVAHKARGIVFHLDLSSGESVHASLAHGQGPPSGHIPLVGASWEAFGSELERRRDQRDEVLLGLTEVLRRLAAANVFAGMPDAEDQPPAVIHEVDDGDDWASVYLRYLELDDHLAELARRRRSRSLAPGQAERALTDLFEEIVRLEVVPRLRAAFAGDVVDKLVLINIGIASSTPYQGPRFVPGSEQAAIRALDLYRDLKATRDKPRRFNARVRQQAELLGHPYAAFREACEGMFTPDFEGDWCGPAFESALASGVPPRHYEFFGTPRVAPSAERNERFIELVLGHADRPALSELFLAELPNRIVDGRLLDGLTLHDPWTLESRFDVQRSERVVRGSGSSTSP